MGWAVYALVRGVVTLPLHSLHRASESLALGPYDRMEALFRDRYLVSEVVGVLAALGVLLSARRIVDGLVPAAGPGRSRGLAPWFGAASVCVGVAWLVSGLAIAVASWVYPMPVLPGPMAAVYRDDRLRNLAHLVPPLLAIVGPVLWARASRAGVLVHVEARPGRARRWLAPALRAAGMVIVVEFASGVARTLGYLGSGDARTAGWGSLDLVGAARLLVYLTSGVFLWRQARWVARLGERPRSEIRVPGSGLDAAGVERFGLSVVGVLALLTVLRTAVEQLPAPDDLSRFLLECGLFLALALIALFGPRRILSWLRGRHGAGRAWRDGPRVRTRDLESALRFGLGVWFLVAAAKQLFAALAEGPDPATRGAGFAAAGTLALAALWLLATTRWRAGRSTWMSVAGRVAAAAILLDTVPTLARRLAAMLRPERGVPHAWDLGSHAATWAYLTLVALVTTALIAGSHLRSPAPDTGA